MYTNEVEGNLKMPDMISNERTDGFMSKSVHSFRSSDVTEPVKFITPLYRRTVKIARVSLILQLKYYILCIVW